jgi:hypothetical protein
MRYFIKITAVLQGGNDYSFIMQGTDKLFRWMIYTLGIMLRYRTYIAEERTGI